jgi:hypothetical protein
MADYNDQVNKETPFTKKKILVIIRICDCLKHFRCVCRRTSMSHLCQIFANIFSEYKQQCLPTLLS